MTHDHETTFERPDWNEIYAGEDRLWSGHPNGSLIAEVDGLSPGRALDVGCGEGADAFWLAEQGWDVTAIDVAETAIDRARSEAQKRHVSIDWHTGDFVTTPPAGTFDLVTLHYPAFEIERRAATVTVLTSVVRPGGLLLAVGHAPPDDLSNAPFDPADWVQPADIAADLAADIAADWTIETHETRARPGDHHEGSPHSHDVIVRARRT